jgi:iron complex outermembrane recepter protein
MALKNEAPVGIAGRWHRTRQLPGRSTEAPSSALVNLNLHSEVPENQGKPSHVRVYFEIQNLANHTYVASAFNITDTINATTGAENGPGTLVGVTGSIYAGTPRASFGGVRFKF